MERWQEIVAECGRGALTAQAASRVIAAAKLVLADDLAPFEIVDVISDFMKLVMTVYEHRTEESWGKPVGELVTLIADVLPRYQGEMHNYMEDVVNLCMYGGYSAVVKRKAMQCLVSLSHCSNASFCLESALPTLLNLLRRNDDAITVRVPLSILIGSISENYSELIKDPIAVWRSYCAILEASKTSDTLASAVICGVTSLFNKFGQEIPTADLNAFANSILTDYISKHQCQEAVLKLVSRHSALFRELLASEVKYRDAVWLGCGGSHSAAAAEAIVAVYTAVGMAARTGRFNQDLIWDEIFKQSKLYAHVPNLFLRCSWALVDECRGKVDPNALAKLEAYTAKVVSAIEFELECRVDSLADEPSDSWMYDNEAIKLMEKACWWVSRGEAGSERSLRCLLKLQHKCPSNRRKKLLAHPILHSSGANGIIGFLINESCQSTDSESSIHKYLPLWRDLFDSQGGTDHVVMDNARQLLDEFVDCLLSVVGVCLKSDDEDNRQKVSTLLLLASYILSWEYVEDWLQDSAESLLSATLDCQRALGASEGSLRMMATLTDAGLFEQKTLSGEVFGRIERFYKELSPVRCGSERVLVCVCRALVTAPKHLRKLSSDAHVALQIIFSRKDVEPSLLSKTLLCLQEIVASQGTCHKWFYEIKTRIEKLEKCKTWSGKDARILQRNIYKFLGKFGTATDVNNNLGMRSVDENEDISQTHALTINLPDPVAMSYKLELSQLYETAIRSEDSESLWAFLLMLCSNAASEGGSELEPQLARTVYTLARCYSRGELSASKAPLMEQVALWCARPSIVHMFLQYISVEKSPGVRKVLSNILEQILLRDPHSESSQELLGALTAKVKDMLHNEHATTKKAGLDIAEAIAPALKGNNEFSKTHVSELLALILNTKDGDMQASFEPLAKYLEEHIVIFEKYKLDTLATDSVRNLFSGEIVDFSALKMVIRKTLEMNRVVRNFLKETDDIWKAFTCDLDDGRTSTRLYVLAEAKGVFDWDLRTCRDVVSCEDFALVNAMLRHGELKDDAATEFLVEAMLRFLGEYADCLTEFQYEKTSKILANMLTRQPPKMLKRLRSEIIHCFQRYRKIWSNDIPKYIRDSYKLWFSGLPIKEVSDKMKFRHTDHANKDIVSALRITLEALNSREVEESLQENKDLIKQWPSVILNLFEDARVMDRTKREFLTEALSVSFHFVSSGDVTDCVCRNLKFYGKFVKAFGEYMLREPEVLFDARLEPLLSDVVRSLIKYAVMEQLDDEKKSELIALVDKLWLKLNKEPVRSLHAIMCELCLVRARPLNIDSNVARWLLTALTTNRALEDKAMLMEMMSCVVCCSDGDDMLVRAIKSYEEILPHLLSELSDRCSPRCFKAALSALAATKNPHLMRLILNVAIGDKKSGWWDRDIEKCMEALANSSDIAEMLMEHALKQHYPPHSRVLLMDRLLVPLLQWSTSSFCERFFSTHLKKMRSMLTSVPSELNKASGVHLDRYLLDCIVAFNLARVMFEKVSAWSVESCDSPLYESVRSEAAGRSWWLVRDICTICVTLRTKFATPPSSEYARLFHCANYNCLAAAITKRGVFKIYAQLFAPEIWPLIVDCEKVITRWGPLEKKPSTHRRRHNVSVPVDSEGAAGSHSTVSMRRSSSHTALFLRSLSDNPLQYDLLNSDTETSSCQSVVLTSSELNDNECAATLSALLCHLAAAQGAGDADWATRLAGAVSNEDTPGNARATLAQIICNCKDDLLMHSDTFRSALLSVIARRPADKPGLNGLDVAVLDTIFFWAEQKPPTNVEHRESVLLSSCLQFLLEDLVSPRHASKFVPEIILSKIDNLVKTFGAHVSLQWDDVWRKTMIDTNCNQFALKAWQKLTQIPIPNLVTLVADALDPNASKALSNKMAELYGKAMAKCQSGHRYESLKKFYKFVESVRRTNEADYISVIYYAQMGSKDVCNEDNFRLIMGLTSRMPHEPKKKCLKITSDYLSSVNVATECVKDAFQVINVSELLAGGDYSQYGLSMAKNGIRLMDDGARRRIVSQVLEYCSSSQENVRKLAFQVLVAALDDILKSDEHQAPSAKRARQEGLTSRLLDLWRSGDFYERSVLAALVGGLVDLSEDISRLVYEGVERHMSDGISTRLAECVTAVLLLPAEARYSADATRVSRVRARHLSVSVRLLLERMRKGDYFSRMTLRNEPLKKRIESAPRAFQASRLLTLSSRFQGSFRSGAGGPANIGARREGAIPEVEVPYDNILKAFIDFAEMDGTAARVLFQSSLRAILMQENALRADLSHLVTSLPACDVTPALVDAFRMCVAQLASNDSFFASVARLCELSRGSASQHQVALLHEDLVLNRPGCEVHFHWTHAEEDVEMSEEKKFTIEGLLDAAERMCDWDELTHSQRRRATAASAPLWTTSSDFQSMLDRYFEGGESDRGGRTAWLARLYSVWKGEDGRRHEEWLRSVREWPVDIFAAAATVEAIEWHEVRNSSREWREVCSGRLDLDATNMAHTAALLMFRSLLCRPDSDSDEGLQEEMLRSLRAREADWTRAAVAREAYEQALVCVERNAADSAMFRSEVMSWKLAQLRCRLALTPQPGNAQQILKQAEPIIASYRDYTKPDVVLDMSELMVTLSGDVGASDVPATLSVVEQTIRKMSRICEDMRTVYEDGVRGGVQTSAKSLLKAFRTTAIYCDHALDTCDAPTRSSVLSSMADSVLACVEHDRGSDCSTVVSMLVMKLLSQDHDVVQKILNKLGRVASRLDAVTLDVIRRMRERQWRNIPMTSLLLDVLEENVEQRETWSRRLASLRDPSHALKSLYEQIYDALRENDGTKMTSLLAELKENVGTLNAGVAYQILEPHRAKLQSLIDIDLSSKAATETAKKLLSDTMNLLDQARSSMPLADVCPLLSSYPECVSERDRRCLDDLLGIGGGVHVVKFDKQLRVITSSQRRPVLVRALLSDGRARTYLVKAGEDVRNDESCQRVQTFINGVVGRADIYTYKVTPLGSNAGLIEYLDRFVTVRSLMSKGADLHQLLSVSASVRPEKDLSQLARPENRTRSLRLHHEMLSKAPPTLLRSAIEAECRSVEEFIRARRVYLRTLTAMTISHWLLGVGDRHLENVMVEARSGALCGVDWGCLWDGLGPTSVPELQPARLTRSLLAVHLRSLTLLESGMQKIMQVLRTEWRPLYAACCLAFHWQPEYATDAFQNKLRRLKRKLSGAALSIHTTSEALEESGLPDAEVFHGMVTRLGEIWTDKDIYSVEEQVSALLLQCTSEELLAVSRSGWEPWL